MSNDELIHYGRKGMKWYQNIYTKDKRRNRNTNRERSETNRKSRDEISSRNKKRSSSVEYYARKTGTRKQQQELISKLSTKDLEDIVKRARLENDYLNLTSYKSTGEKALDIFKKWALDVALTSSKEIVRAELKKRLNNSSRN